MAPDMRPLKEGSWAEDTALDMKTSSQGGLSLNYNSLQELQLTG